MTALKLEDRLAALTPKQRALLAARVKRTNLDPTRIAGVDRTAAAGLFPLSVGQRRLWDIHRQAPEIPVNIVSQVLSLDGALDADAMADALQALMARHESLRTRFTADGSGQRVDDDVTLPLTRIKAPQVAAKERDEWVHRFAVEDAWRPFDPSSAPLIRTTLISDDDKWHRLVFTIHNLVFDAWSFDILLRELKRLYNARLDGEAAELDPAPRQYVDYAVWQEGWLRSVPYRRQLDYWRALLAPLRPAEIPADRPRQERRSWRGKRVNFTLPKTTKEKLTAMARAEGATLFMALAALAQLLVHARSGGEDVCIGTLNANRSRPEIENVLGFFLNIAPVHGRLAADSTFKELLVAVKKASLGAMANGDVPYEEMVRELGLDLEAARNPLFDLLFIFENIPPAAETFRGLRMGMRDMDKQTARFDLSLAVYDDVDLFHGWLEYNVELFDERTATAIAEQFATMTKRAAKDGGLTLRELLGSD